MNINNYYTVSAQELLLNLEQVRVFIKKHNPTIGVLTEEIIREFLRKHLPKAVSVEQGFIQYHDGSVSKQVDILIYDSMNFGVFYRVNDIVVIPHEAVISIIEVKTTLNKTVFNDLIKYFASFEIPAPHTHLFIFNSVSLNKLYQYFHSYKHPGTYQKFDHDTFEFLPDYITALNNSYHLAKDYVITDSDYMGYSSYFFENLKGKKINALELFFNRVYSEVENYLQIEIKRDSLYKQKKVLSEIGLIPLFYM